MGNIINSDQNKGRVDYYIDKGKISLLPKLFQNYQTSYFYKFSKIQKFAEGNLEYEEVKDSLPNYIRITLESFMAFKFVRLRGKDKYLPAMFDALIKHINHCDLNHYKSVDLIKDKAALIAALQRIQHKVNPESHGTVQDITNFEYLPESELKDLAQLTIDVIHFLDQIHYQKIQEISKGVA